MTSKRSKLIAERWSVEKRLLLACAGAALFATPSSADPVSRGKYLATLGDCVVCHTAPQAGSAPFAGGYPLHAYFGTVYSTNITPDKKTGIGSWTADQFYRAFHAGRAADGHYLYPAFPYAYFAKVPRSDSDALYAYLRTIKPVYQPPTPNLLIFPTNIRLMMVFWNWLFYPQSQSHLDTSKSAAWNRGATLVHGLGHCGGCHTPKNLFFSDESGKAFYGDTVDGWYATNLTSSSRSGLGAWSPTDISEFLKTGSNKFGRVVGAMRDVISKSTSQMSDSDRNDIAVYLKSLPAAPEKAVAKPDPRAMANGNDIFVSRCSACHEDDKIDYPSLIGNTTVVGTQPTTVVRVILQGSQSALVDGRPVGFSMPAFPVLTNKELADVTTFIRNSWGNRASPLSEDEAREIRTSLRSTE